MSDSTIDLDPDRLFVVACPVCQGQVAASGRLRGRDACCPLCASLFHVPFPRASPPPHASAERPKPEPAPEPSPRPPRAVDPAPPPGGVAEDWEGVITSLAPPVPPAEAPPPQPAPESFDLPPAETAAADGEGGTLPDLEGTPLDPGGDELAFKEPVRTMQVGGELIEIRRLSPEERRQRRFRRNLLMIVVGISILLTIVALSFKR